MAGIMNLKTLFVLMLLVSTILISGCIDKTYAISEPTIQSTPEIRYVYVTPKPTSTPYPAPTSRVSSYPQGVQRSFSDYQWRLDLISEQSLRLDMYYATKSGMLMSCEEREAFISSLRSYTNEFVSRNLEAVESGKNYVNQMRANSDNINIDKANLEIERVRKNVEISYSDIQITMESLNGNIDSYNKICAS